MGRKVFIKWDTTQFQAYLGWQDDEITLINMKEGYKNGADNLVSLALEEGEKDDKRTPDTFIYPILSLYQLSIEISLKQLHRRLYGEFQKDGHDLISLLNLIENRVKSTFDNPDFTQWIKKCKKSYILYSIDTVDFNQIRSILEETQHLTCNNDGWRYLMDKGGELYYMKNEFMDYKQLKDNIGNIYDQLEYLYYIVSELVAEYSCD